MLFLDKIIFYSLAWAIFWIPFIGLPNGVLSKNFMDLGLEVALLAWLIKLFITRKTGFSKIGFKFENAFTGIAVASLFSIPFSFIKIWAWGDFMGILIGIFSIYLFTSMIKTKQQFFIIWSALILGITFSGLFGFLQIFLKNNLDFVVSGWGKTFSFLTDYAHPSRISATFLSQSGVNVYSAYLIAIIPLVLIPLIFQYKKINPLVRFSSSIILLILFCNLIMTKGRAAYIALFGALFYTFFQNRKQRKILLSALIIFSLCSIIFIPKVRLTIFDIFNTQSSSNLERVAIYAPAIQQALQRPLFGWGDGHAGRKVIYNKKARKWEKSKDKKYFVFTSIKSLDEKAAYYKKQGIVPIHRPHNIYLTTLIETGLLGFIAFIYLFYILIKLTNKFYWIKGLDPGLKSQFLGVSGAFVSIALYGFLHDSLNSRPYAILFWVLIAFASILIKLSKNTLKNK